MAFPHMRHALWFIPLAALAIVLAFGDRANTADSPPLAAAMTDCGSCNARQDAALKQRANRKRAASRLEPPTRTPP